MIAEADTSWPAWAVPQLDRAVVLARRLRAHDERTSLAAHLYRAWFNASVGEDCFGKCELRPLAGIYRGAHAASARRVVVDGLATLAREDAIGRDGWWRTWGPHWRPISSRRDCIRMIMTPYPGAVAELVALLTSTLQQVAEPWLLAATTDSRRLRRIGGMVLHVAANSALPAELAALSSGLVMSVLPPLCLPISAGAALSEVPDNGLSFGEHRCHLVALALEPLAGRRAPLPAIARVFAANGIDPSQPHRSPQAVHLRPTARRSEPSSRLA